MKSIQPRALALLMTVSLLATPAGLAAQTVSDSLESASPQTRRYLEHVVLLAHPALEGRLPGEEGSALAERVIARTFEQLGLEGGFDSGAFEQAFSFRQGGRFGARDDAQIVTGNNIAAVIPGVGGLAQEWVLIGAHHDHLGLGAFGSRRGAGQIHEGADDNASGTAGVLLAAELLAERAAQSEAPRRSILLVTFSGEESGLNGSSYFCENSPVPLEAIALMLNMDMIGRLSENAVAVTGTGSGTGLGSLLADAAKASTLEVRTPEGLSSRSDHAEFYRRGVPVLFFTETVFPDEYHTPEDESWRINFTDGAAASGLAAEVAWRAAVDADRPKLLKIEGFETGEDGPSLADIKVRFGIKPGNYGDTEAGIAVAGVTEGTSAQDGGLLAGDRLVKWNGAAIEGVREWMMQLAAHEPGDIVQVTVIRDGNELSLPVMLQPR